MPDSGLFRVVVLSRIGLGRTRTRSTLAGSRTHARTSEATCTPTAAAATSASAKRRIWKRRKKLRSVKFWKMTEELYIGAKQSSLGALVTRCSINQKSLISGHISFYLKFMFFKVGQKVNKYLSHFVKNYGKKIFQKWPNLVTLKWWLQQKPLGWKWIFKKNFHRGS